MTDTFTASNGDTVETCPDGHLVVRYSHDTEWLSPFAVDALREYFQHERDQELGRWRDPENPNLIVYPDGPDLVRVVNETTGVGWDVTRPLHLDDLDAPSWHGAALRYFAAHPEQKPWHSAAEGDIWLLDGADHPGTLKPYQTVIDTDGETVQGPRFFPAYRIEWTPGAFPREFTAGCRIWPTGDDDE